MIITIFITGQDCEIDVSVCNATESKCLNGGECIDGLGPAFQCECPSGTYRLLHQVIVKYCFSI